jgi:hypothetical protein
VKIQKYTFGTGDRFAHQGRAQLRAILNAREAGIDVHPVWNKSNREHSIIKSKPDDVRAEADAAVAALGFTGAYDKLPHPKSVMGWSSSQYVDALRHVESSSHYNPNFRQLLHVGFKVAAGMGKRFTGALEANEEIVGRNVTQNLFDRHLKPIFA